MTTTPTLPTLTSPELIDRAVGEINTSLTSSLSWLNSAFGKVQVLKEEKDGRTIVFPAVYAGGSDYLKLFPDSHIGNFSFFEIKDPTNIVFARGVNYSLEVDFGLVVWFDFRTVYPSPADWQTYTSENVKAQVLAVLLGGGFANVRVRKAFQLFDLERNIYRGFTDLEIDRQYLTRPFGGFRIEGEFYLENRTLC